MVESIASPDDNIETFLRLGLVSPEDVLYGELRLRWTIRRNRNVALTRRTGPALLIKQPTELSQAQSLHQEAAFYILVEEHVYASMVRTYVPSLQLYDKTEHLLAIELIEQSQNLWQTYQSSPPAIPVTITHALGTAVGAIHNCFSGIAERDPGCLRWLRSELPWIMHVHQPTPELMATLSAASYETIRIVQEHSELTKAIDKIKGLWRPSTLIHGDLKSDNILVRRHDASSVPQVSLVDWELAQYGDPAWDIAGVLQDLIIFWVNSMRPSKDIDEMVRSSELRLRDIHRPIRAFLTAYFEAQDYRGKDRSCLLLRSVQFSALRLIQSAYEKAQMGSSLSPHSVTLLQISHNILADPQVHQVRTYGIYNADS
jgi:tRNA A-37 threonylcarbamoyl transferase component Bud32